jgi:hypothetical protein
MTVAIGGTEKSGYFRWHDSGDLQSLNHLNNIVEIANNLPHITFWLPTREYSIVSEWLKANNRFPINLTVRLSALMIDKPAPISFAKKYSLVTSGVSDVGFNCPSSKQGNKCQLCRACWDKSVFNINYKTH